MEKVILTGKTLGFEQFNDVVYKGILVEIDESAMERARRAREVLFKMAEKGKPVYGLNRGVGWNKDKEFDKDFFDQYNRNLLNCHSLGVSPYCTEEEVRGMMLIRLNTALCGSTGISTEILEMYKTFLNRKIHPRVKHRGSIGEGDITTLSLIGQAMMGEGEVNYQGEIIAARKALEKENIKPVIFGPKDGLSIVSSNAQGATLCAMVIKETEEILTLSNLVYCLSLEGLNGVVQSLEELPNKERGLEGQIYCAEQCRGFLEGSYLYEYDANRALQDALSFRCAAAIHGSVYDTLQYIKKYAFLQMNSTDDNPYINLDEEDTSVSQNFEVLTLAAGIEMLNIVLCHLSKTICNRLIKLADPEFTHLSRFLTPCDIKTIAYGTIQKVFSNLDAEIRLLANPSSMDYMPVAGQIEDHASNLPLVADKTLHILDDLRYILGIEAMHAVQAIDLRGITKLGKETNKAKEKIRATVPFLDKDRNLSIDIEKMYQLFRNLEWLLK